MNATLRFSAILVLAALGLAACKNDGGTNMSTAPQDQFGPAYSKAFAADDNAVPIDPMPGDAGTLSLTTDPVDF